MSSAQKHTQKGSLRQVPRANNNWDWEFRYTDPATGCSQSRYYSGLEFPAKSDIESHLVPFRLRINAAKSGPVILDPTVNDLLDLFIAEENLIEIRQRKPGERAPKKDELAYSTALSYLSLSKRIRAKWGAVNLDEFSPLKCQQWLREEVVGAPKTKGHLKSFLHRLLNKAKLYEMVSFVENPIHLIEVRGISKRLRKPATLTVEQFFLVIGLLPEPYHTMALIAQCTGLRVEEVLALYWPDIDFDEKTMLVTRAVVHGRICWVKTEYSEDALPLDENFAELLRALKKKAGESELLFPSPKTGHCYHASPIQQDYIRRAGWCLVACPVCKAAPGTACTMVLEGKGSLPQIPVHDERRALATRKKLGSVGWHTFRHTYRLWLDESGAPLGVQQKLMRHADIRTTMNQYGDSAMSAKRKANSKVVEMVLVRKSSLIEFDQNVEAGAAGARRMG